MKKGKKKKGGKKGRSKDMAEINCTSFYNFLQEKKTKIC